MRILFLLLLSVLTSSACFVNEAEESAGNDSSQDSGLHISLANNFVLNSDGSRVVGILTNGEQKSLFGLGLPDFHYYQGVDISELDSPEIMLTQKPHTAYLIEWDEGEVEQVIPLDLSQVTASQPLQMPSGFAGAIMNGSGQFFALAKVWVQDEQETNLIVKELPSGQTLREFHIQGGIFDIRYTKQADRMIVASFTERQDDTGDKVVDTHVEFFDLTQAGLPSIHRMTIENFAPNLLGYLTWSIRISPDGNTFTISGRREGQPITMVGDIHSGTMSHFVACDGPIGFSPDSKTIIGFMDFANAGSQIVIHDLLSQIDETIPLEYSTPVYWISPDGTRLAIHSWLSNNNELIVVDLDTLEVKESSSNARLGEFVTSPDGDFIYLIDGGALMLLDLMTAEVSVLEDSQWGYNNLNIVPSGENLVLSRCQNSRFELWNLTAANVTKSLELNTPNEVLNRRATERCSLND